MSLVRKDFQGITDMYLDTAAYNLDPSFNYYLQDPKELDQRRLRAYKYYMDFYDGKHWDDTVGSLTMSEWNPAYGYYYSWNEDFNRRTWNVSKNIIDKLISWVCQEEWKVKVPVELQPEPKKPRPQQRVDNIQKNSFGADSSSDDDGPQKSGGSSSQDSDSQSSSSKDSNEGSTPPSKGPPGQTSSKTPPGKPQSSPAAGQGGGDNFGQSKKKAQSSSLTPSVEDEKEEDDDSPQALLENFWSINSRHEFTYDIVCASCIVGDAYAKLAFDPDFYADGVGELVVQPLDPRTVMPFWDGHNKRKMIGCRIQYPTKEVQADGSIRTRMYSEIHTDATIIEMLDGEVDKAYPNPLGEIMIIHFPNEPLPYRKYGRSDLEGLILPQKEYNEKNSDFSEILAYHAAPVTIIKGARVQTLEKGARKIWGGIPKDGDVYNLGLDSDLSSAISYLETLKKHIHETGSVPEEALGALQEVSNTSAAALHVQYQPLIERVIKKQIHLGKGFCRINELVLKFYEVAEVLELPEDIPIQKKYKTEIEWGDALPRDRSIQLADLSTEMGLGIESKKGALIRLGEEAPERKIQEIMDEQMKDAELQFQTAGLFGPEDPGTGPGGDPQQDVSGSVNKGGPTSANPTQNGSNIANQAVKKSAQTTLDNNS